MMIQQEWEATPTIEQRQCHQLANIEKLVFLMQNRSDTLANMQHKFV